MRGKTVLVLALACLLVLGLAGAALAALPPGTVVSPSGIVLANVELPASVERCTDIMVLERTQVEVWFKCADAETVRVFDFGGFAQQLPVAVDVKTGKAYAVLPQKPKDLGRWCGYDAPVEYRTADGRYVQEDNLLVPLSDVALGKYVYVRISRAWVDEHPSLFGRPSKK